MIGPLKFIGSITALILLVVLLAALSTSPVEAGPGSGAPPDGLPAPHEWVMVVLLFALVIAFHHCRQSHHHRT